MFVTHPGNINPVMSRIWPQNVRPSIWSTPPKPGEGRRAKTLQTRLVGCSPAETLDRGMALLKLNDDIRQLIRLLLDNLLQVRLVEAQGRHLLLQVGYLLHQLGLGQLEVRFKLEQSVELTCLVLQLGVLCFDGCAETVDLVLKLVDGLRLLIAILHQMCLEGGPSLAWQPP